MGMQMLEISNVKRKEDVHILFAQKCMFNGYNIAIGTFVFGVATLPYALMRIKGFTRFTKEYRIFVGVFVSVGAALSSGVYYKKNCQTKIVNELKELNLGHLVEGIET